MADHEVLTFDLNEWPPDLLEKLEIMLEQRSIAFTWDPPGVLNVAAWNEHDVDAFLDILEAEPEDHDELAPLRPGPMSVDDFYRNPRRQDSEEVDLGRAWTDADGVRHDLCWLRDTGELTLMRAAGRPTIEVLATASTLDAVEARFGGWAEAMVQPNSVAWLRERAAGVRARPATAPPEHHVPVDEPAITDDLWIIPAAVGWITEEMDEVFAAYVELRATLDPDRSLERALVTTLDRESWERLTDFFAGDRDVVYGDGAGEQARIAIRDALEERRAHTTGS